MNTYLYFWKKLGGSKSLDHSAFPWRISSVTLRPVRVRRRGRRKLWDQQSKSTYCFAKCHVKLEAYDCWRRLSSASSSVMSTCNIQCDQNNRNHVEIPRLSTGEVRWDKSGPSGQNHIPQYTWPNWYYDHTVEMATGAFIKIFSENMLQSETVSIRCSSVPYLNSSLMMVRVDVETLYVEFCWG